MLKRGITMGCRSICYGSSESLLPFIAVSPMGVRQILRRVMVDTATSGVKLSLL
jgi:hypothetical protein